MKMNSRQRAMTVGSLPTPFGCCNFFDHCSDEILSLHFSGQLGLLDVLGFEVATECYKSVEFVTFVRPAFVEDAATAGHLSDACAAPNGIEYGFSKITVEDFGRYGRTGPTRDIMKAQRYCKTDPRRRLDGTPVTDEREWDLRFTTEVLLQDIMRDVITGNASVAGQFDGLERWVRTGYNHNILDSIVVDWNGNDFNGGAGITWNGGAIGATYNFIDVLLAAYRRIRTRIGWSKVLAAQQMREGDMILVLPSFMVNCLLNAFTCWSVCPGKEYNEANVNTYEARNFRLQLSGGMFGYGEIQLDGFTIPILAYDYGLIKGPTHGDIYLLTLSVGGVRLWSGEHIDAGIAAREYGDQGYFTVDGGRILGKVDTENECRQMKLWMHPRLFNMAPWANVRFQDVVCGEPFGPLSGDPLETSFYPTSSFVPAACP